jgi:hypothetical protein
MPPKKGYKPGYGFKPKGKEGILGKAKEAARKAKEKASRSSSSGGSVPSPVKKDKYNYKYKG